MPKKLFESNFWEVALSFLQVALNSLYISNYGSVYNRIKSNQQEKNTYKKNFRFTRKDIVRQLMIYTNSRS